MAELPVGGAVSILALHLVPRDGFSALKGLVQPAVPAGNALVYVPVQRHSQHQFLRRDAAGQPGGNAVVHAGAVAGRAVRGRVERRVEVRRGVPGPVEVISHEKNMVHGFRHRLGLDAVQIAAAHRPGDGQDIALPVPPPLPVQGFPELSQQQGEVLLILGLVDHAGGPAGNGVLPVQIHAVQAVRQKQVYTGPGKHPPAFRGGRRVGKPGGIVPAAEGEHDF